jgi:hypothetical protein
MLSADLFILYFFPLNNPAPITNIRRPPIITPNEFFVMKTVPKLRFTYTRLVSLSGQLWTFSMRVLKVFLTQILTQLNPLLRQSARKSTP